MNTEFHIEQICETAKSIHWAALWHPANHPETVVESLNGIFDRNPDISRAASGNLFNSLVPQGSLLPGAFYIVPFLVEGLKYAEPDRVHDTMVLLSQIACGVADEYELVTYEPKIHPFPHMIPSPLGISVPLEIACKTAVAHVLPALVRFTHTKDVSLRRSIEMLIEDHEECKFDYCHMLRGQLASTKLT